MIFFLLMVCIYGNAIVWKNCYSYTKATLREESCQTNVILQYKLLAAILIAVCSVIQ